MAGRFGLNPDQIEMFDKGRAYEHYDVTGD